MGFLTTCYEVLLRVSSYAGVLNEPSQHPLPLHGHAGHELAAGVSFAPQNASAGFQCQYPSLAGWEACNSPSDRGCWLNDPAQNASLYQYNVTTDYEDFSPPGVTREYWLNVSVNPISPDGYVKPLAQVFNNTFPGPLLEACWGDRLIVHVTNYNAFEGHTTHWHGIRQLGTNEYDGVNGVTQCPIAQNATFTYNFTITQYSHTWYHSHYQTQYSDGALGALTLYGPSSADYDEAFAPIFVNDWIHENSSVVFEQELNGGIPVMDNILFNGTGTYLCSDLDPRCCSACHGACTIDTACGTSVNPTGTAPSTFFTRGKRYLLRLINASAESMFLFSIDGHNLTVVANDLVPIQPYTTTSLFIGIGQRYSVIVDADPSPASSDGNYWIRARLASGCGNVVQSSEKVAVLRYNSSTANTATPTTLANDNRILCEDEPLASLKPVVPWSIPSIADINGNLTNYTFEADLSAQPQHNGVSRWELLDQALFLNYSDPSIIHVDDDGFQYAADYCIVPYNYTGEYVWLIITGEHIDQTKRNAPAAHPIHLHGHDFVILGQDNSTFDASNTTALINTFNLDNPPRRDVALLYAGGYLALAFRPDNPGVWLVHCHIAWHASSGLALQVMERRDDIIGSLGGESALNPVRDGCKSWDEWKLPFLQDDSGI